MRPDSPNLQRLWTAAALTSGWPVLRAEVPSEDAAVSLTEALEGLVGPCPQAVWLGPDRGEGPWRLQCALPNLTATDALVLQDRLAVWFSPGPRPELAWARELGLRCDSETWADGVCFIRPQTEDADVPPEWVSGGGVDAVLEAVELEVAEAVRAVRGELASTSDRGVDTARLVRELVTGRVGLVWSFGSLGGEWVPEVLEAIASVVRSRAEHPLLRLAPDVWWWSPLDGLDVVTWLVVPAQAPPMATLPVGHEGWLHVVPAASHADAALAVASWAESSEADLVPLEPQWLWVNEQWVFCPTWRGGAGAELASLPEVASVRAVPWVEAFEGAGPAVAVSAWASENGWAIALRHADRDRDWMPPAESRMPTPADAAVLACHATLRHTSAPRPVQSLSHAAMDLVVAAAPAAIARLPVPEGWQPVRWVVRRPDHCVIRLQVVDAGSAASP